MRPCARLSLAALAASAFLLPTPSAGALNSTLESVSFEADGSSRHLAEAASWIPWPSRTVRNLEVVHNLCDPEWIEALEIAAREWTARSSTVNLRVTASNCISRDNADLSYIDNKIRVVYGTCGSGCCGKAGVSYSYRRRNGGLDITEYKALVRLDRKCFDDDYQHNAVGRQYLACHELGHAIGLGHNNDEYSCLAKFRRDNYLPGPDDIRILDNVLYADAGSSPTSIFNPRPPPPTPRPPTPRPPTPRPPTRSPLSPQPRPPTIWYTSSNTLTSVSGDCDLGQCGTCQGDCDSDRHCRNGLKCFFRSGNDPNPPGCQGQAISSVDYCYDPRSSPVFPSPTPRPPTPRPYTAPSGNTLDLVQGGNCDRGQCGQCQGDCDSDKHCKNGLKCFFRNRNAPNPPGCDGQATRSVDYCYDPFATALPSPTRAPPTPRPPTQRFPTPRPPTPRPPTQRPPTPRPPTQRQPRTRRPTYGLPQMGRNYNDGTVPYVLVSRRPPYEQCSNSRLCGICEGDCDNDSHCSGKLKCFIRHGSEAVPGCSGGNDKAGKDFCYDPNPSPVPYNSNDVWFSF